MVASTTPIAIKAVLFDLDGTLLDTEALSDKAIFFALRHALPAGIWKEQAATSYRLPWELKKQILGLRGSEWAPIVLSYARERWGVGVTVDDDGQSPAVLEQELWNAWEANMNSYCEEVKACSGATELVQRLAAAGLPLAIATSSRLANVNKKRKRHDDMFAKINAIVAGDNPAVKNGKPAPDIYLEAARQLGVEPEECLVFEDALSGVRSGAAAGCHVVAVPDPRFSPEEKSAFEEEADIVLEDLTYFDGEPFGIDVDMRSATP